MALSRRQWFFPLRQEPRTFAGPADHGFIYDQYYRYTNLVKPKLLLSILLIFFAIGVLCWRAGGGHLGSICA
jgi:hypothetical protein